MKKNFLLLTLSVPVILSACNSNNNSISAPPPDTEIAVETETISEPEPQSAEETVSDNTVIIPCKEQLAKAISSALDEAHIKDPVSFTIPHTVDCSDDSIVSVDNSGDMLLNINIKTDNNILTANCLYTNSSETWSVTYISDSETGETMEITETIETTENHETQNETETLETKPVSLSDSTVNTQIGNYGEPDEIELMTYAQTVLKDYYPNLKISSNKDDYIFARTDMRYKIKGSFLITKDAALKSPFEMIIRFTDNSFNYYDLLSLYVDGNLIYESASKNDLALSSEQKASSDDILTEENMDIYNNVLNKLYAEPDRSEDEIFEELAPQYGMSGKELKDFINKFMEAYYH